jgi:pyrophosphatase PpaX
MNDMNEPLTCVIFDMDGTLTQTNELIFASFNHVASKYLGRTFTPPEIIAMFGPPETGAVKALFGEDRIARAMDELIEFYRDRHAELARLHTGMDEILSFLKGRGVHLALFTGKGRRTTGITLDAFGLNGVFSPVVTGDDVVHHKPHPEGIRKVLDHHGLRPEQVLMVGDSMADVRASKAAGVRMAAVLWDSYEPEKVLAAETALVFHRVDELMKWFQGHIN